jgi:chemotaxis family two-component system sensor kinase Cph1
MVTAYLSLLQDRYGNQLGGTAKQYMDFAIEGGVRAKELIADLLEFSRLDTQGLKLQKTSMEGVLNRVVENLALQIKEEGAVLTHEHLPVVVADESQMVQLLQNLVSNAIKFHNAEPPRIHIFCRERGNEWLFIVKDSGIGIDPAYSEKIFVLFQRLHTRDEYEGTGIGLAISKKIVERHGGRIWVESEEGKGSSFLFSLPKRNGS